MNIEKSNLKILIANDLGADIEDRLEAEQKATYELNGAAQALRQAAKKIPWDLAAKIDQTLEAGEIPDGQDAAQVAQFAKKYLTKVGDFLLHLSDVEQQKAVAQGGRVDGLRQVMDLLKKRRDHEAAKIKAFAELVNSSEDTVVLRTVASAARQEHGSAADRRLTEEKLSEEKPPVTPDEVAEELPPVTPDEIPEAMSTQDSTSLDTPKKRKLSKKAKTQLRAVKKALPK